MQSGATTMHSDSPPVPALPVQPATLQSLTSYTGTKLFSRPPGNGQSDRPKLFVRSRWWTIDDHVEKDVPAVLSYVRRVTGADQVHVVSWPWAVLGKGSGGWGRAAYGASGTPRSRRVYATRTAAPPKERPMCVGRWALASQRPTHMRISHTQELAERADTLSSCLWSTVSIP